MIQQYCIFSVVGLITHMVLLNFSVKIKNDSSDVSFPSGLNRCQSLRPTTISYLVRTLF